MLLKNYQTVNMQVVYSTSKDKVFGGGGGVEHR